mgnify:CR=1 FL=1
MNWMMNAESWLATCSIVVPNIYYVQCHQEILLYINNNYISATQLIIEFWFKTCQGTILSPESKHKFGQSLGFRYTCTYKILCVYQEYEQKLQLWVPLVCSRDFMTNPGINKIRQLAQKNIQFPQSMCVTIVFYRHIPGTYGTQNCSNGKKKNY